MTKDAIFDRMIAIIKSQLDEPNLVIDKETDLRSELNIDSIALMEFIISLEDSFNMSISDEDIDDMKTIGQMLDYLDHKINK